MLNSHQMARCVALLTSALLLGSAGAAHAFDLEEHLEVGRRGYFEACRELTQELESSRHYQTGLWPLEAQRRLTEIACFQYENLAIHYGQFVGLSGDHVSIDQLGTVHGDIDAENLVVYLQLAIQNADHFFPANVQKYDEIHDRALDVAAAAATLSDGPEAWLQVRKQFWRAFYASAFADHFLQDTFAAGHGAFNRPASTPAASRGYHNNLNREGMVLRDGAGRVWASYGDGKLNFSTRDHEGQCKILPAPRSLPEQERLCKTNDDAREEGLVDETQKVRPLHDRGKALLVAATRESVRDVLLTFVSGQRSPARERSVALRIPSDCLGTERSGCTPATTIDTLLSRELTRDALVTIGGNVTGSEVERLEAVVHGSQRELEICERLQLPPLLNCDDIRENLNSALTDLRGAYALEAQPIAEKRFWAPVLAAQDPARLEQYIGAEWFYFGRPGPQRHLTGPALNFRFYTPLLLWGPRFGYYWQTADAGPSDRGFAVGITAGVPIAMRYGSVVSWEFTFRPTLFQPFGGPSRITHVALPVGLQVGLQLGFLTAGIEAAYAPNYARQIGPTERDPGWGHGWEGALSLAWGFGVAGGGFKRAPPL